MRDVKEQKAVLKSLTSQFIFSFPYNSAIDESERKKLYTDLRKNAILNIHITIIINGTRRDIKNGVLENSLGIFEEARISLKQGNLVMPVAIIGGAASIIWDEMNELDTEYVNQFIFKL